MFGAITRNYYRGADAVVVLYAVDNRTTFDHCDSWREDFANVVDEEKVAVMLVVWTLLCWSVGGMSVTKSSNVMIGMQNGFE